MAFGFQIASSSPGGYSIDPNGRQLKGPDSANTLDWSQNGALQLRNVTTTQRDALTPAEGMVVYNSTVHELQSHNGTSWGLSNRIMQMVATKATATGTSSTAETTLWDSPAFGKTLTAVGDSYHFRLVGTIVAHASRTRRLILYFRYLTSNYFAVGDTTAIVVNTTNPVFVVEGTIIRRADQSDPVLTRITINGATGGPITDSLASTIFGANIEGIKLTGTCGAGSSDGDINLDFGEVWFAGKEP